MYIYTRTHSYLFTLLAITKGRCRTRAGNIRLQKHFNEPCHHSHVPLDYAEDERGDGCLADGIVNVSNPKETYYRRKRDLL